MTNRREQVARLQKKNEFEIRFSTRNAEKGWTNLLVTTRNAIVDAWDFLTKTPHAASEGNHPMRDELEFISVNGNRYPRWQYELPGGARIWFYVHEQVVWIIDVHTRHPNQTK